MTVARLREIRAKPAAEQRGQQMTSWPMGAGWNNPAAIPPPNMGQMQRAGVMVTQHTSLQVDVVFTSLRVISNNVVKMGDLWAYEERLSSDNIPYRVYLAEQPPILADTWGGRMFQTTGLDRTVWSMGLFGEAFWYVVDRDRLAYPAALDVLHPAFMEIKAAKDGTIEYLYGTGSNRVALDPENVVHIPFKSLPTALRALNPVEYAGVAIALAMAAYEFGSTWFSQGASPDFILSTEQKLGQTEVERIAAKFLIEHSGLQSAHLPLVIDSGLKAEKVMSSPDEAQYLQTLEFARSVIASWFGVPYEWIGGNALQRPTPAPPGTMQEESMKFLQHTLSGYLTPLAEAYSSLLPSGVKAAFQEDKLVEPNAAQQAELIMNLRQTQAASVNDVRTRMLHWAPSEDPDADKTIAPLASNTAPSQTKDDAAADDQRAAGLEASVRRLGSDQIELYGALSERLAALEAQRG